MRVHFKAMESYGAGNLASQAATANGVDLIQMLFDGLIESLTAAQGHLQRGAIQEKGKSLSRASRIVVGLQSSLDFKKGGELAQNLNELYSYVTRRLIHANARNDLQAVVEVLGLMGEIREAWKTVPSQISAQTLENFH